MNSLRYGFALVLTGLLCSPALARDIPLYETGPAEDAAFIRFVNGSNKPMAVVGAQGRPPLELPSSQPVSDYLPVAANRPLKGDFTQEQARASSETTVKPGEFVTVIGLNDSNGALTTRTLREAPEDFNALKASLAAYNLSHQCPNAGIQVAGRNLAIFKAIAPDSVSERRMINPVSLSVQLTCDDKPVGEPVALGPLEAAGRYTLFLLPSDDGTRLVPATDTMAF